MANPNTISQREIIKNSLETIKADLKFQLTHEDFDWVYFIETAKHGDELQCKLIDMELDIKNGL